MNENEEEKKSPGFALWIDADACPFQAKDIVYNYAFKQKIPVTLVANSFQKTPRFHLIKLIVVDKGPDVADHYILNHAQKNHVVITADIPLAGDLIKKGCFVITPKGDALDDKNISERLSVRNFFDHLRSSGQHHSRSASYDDKHKKQFAASLDRLVARLKNLS